MLLFWFYLEYSDAVVEKCGLSQQFLRPTVCSGPVVDFSRTLFHHSLSSTYLPSQVNHSLFSTDAFQRPSFAALLSVIPHSFLSFHLIFLWQNLNFPKLKCNPLRFDGNDGNQVSFSRLMGQKRPFFSVLILQTDT